MYIYYYICIQENKLRCVCGDNGHLKNEDVPYTIVLHNTKVFTLQSYIPVMIKSESF